MKEGGAMDTVLLVLLAVISYTDIKRRQIPDWCCMCIAALAVISGAVFFGVSSAERIAGAVCISVPMYSVALAVPGSFGGGDIKLMGAAGALLGVKRILQAGLMGILCAGVYALYLLIIKNTGRKAEFPLGPFLCLGIAVNVLWYSPYWQAVILSNVWRN